MSNTNMQTQTSNALHNAIMEAGGKDRPPMLASGNYVQWKSRIKRNIDMKPNNELIHYCLQNPPYTYQWTEKTVPVTEDTVMSDSEDSTVTYTAVSSPFEDGSDIGSPGVDGPPIMPEDPYAYIMAAYQVPPSPDYIPGPEEPQSPPPLDFVPEPMYPENSGHISGNVRNEKSIRMQLHKVIDVIVEQEEALVQLDAAASSIGRMTSDDQSDDQGKEAVIVKSFERIHRSNMVGRDLLASLIEKLKFEIDDSKNRNKILETSNKALVDKLKGDIEDLKTKNKSLESSNNHFKEATMNVLRKYMLMFKHLKKFQEELDKYHDVNYASKLRRGNPRLYDIGCYNDNLALMLTPESDEMIRLAKESRLKLSDLIRPFDYDQVDNLYDLFVHNGKSA
ncbi:hypothetical protein Tco_0767737 [Tanacetum coccineum]